MPSVLILTRHRDFHAYAIRFELAHRDIDCFIAETDTLAENGNLSWSACSDISLASLNDIDGRTICLQDIDLIWWRRLNAPPQIPDYVPEDARELVANDCRGALVGMFLTRFNGTWISHPEANRVAENKLVQLDAARAVGLRTPDTLVSQNPEAVRAFCERHDFKVIAKAVVGSPRAPAMTGRVTPELLADERAVRLCPAIYQELIPGTRHLRVCCFGEDVYAALLETERLDWRYPLDATARPADIDVDLSSMLRSVLGKLSIRMGIFDLKLTPAGEPVWLEVNPQGQFLFLEGMCGMPLTQRFSDFLEDELRKRTSVPSDKPSDRISPIAL